MIQYSTELLGWDSDLMPLLEHRLKEFELTRRVTTREYRHTPLGNLLTSRIKVHSSGVLAADCPWEPDELRLQTIRASGSFYGKPWYSDVAVRVSTGSSRSQEQYARLLLLFEAQLSRFGPWEELAYVRWYKAAKESNPLTKLGAVPLAWDKRPDPGVKSVTGDKSKQATPYCGIIPLSTILRAEMIMPCFATSDRFHVNPFKH
jgi:hypothetical protein